MNSMNNNCSSRCHVEFEVFNAETLLTQNPSTSIRACSPRTAQYDDPRGWGGSPSSRPD